MGNDILVGDANANVFTETAGRNILIGGAGADTLTGGAFGDILIGGTTDYDINAAALQALLANWSRTDLDYSHRVALLLAGVSYTDNSGSHTAVLKGTTVHDDGVVDTLTGGSNPNPSNWFFAHQTGAKDKVNNRKANETVTSI
jgi:Ca2+-binding RTX toxin-like protein